MYSFDDLLAYYKDDETTLEGLKRAKSAPSFNHNPNDNLARVLDGSFKWDEVPMGDETGSECGLYWAERWNELRKEAKNQEETL